MLSTLFARRSASRTSTPRSPGGPRFRPQLEGFEDRVVPAAPAALAPALAAPAAASPASLVPINITNLTLDTVTGALSGVVNVGTQAIGTLTGTLSLTQGTNSAGQTIPILQLHIPDGLHLNLLGLTVDTSPICLDITATSGEGLLGDLLTGLLGGGTLPTLQDALSGLDLTGVQNELQQVLNQGLSTLFSPTSVNGGSVTQSPSGTGNILHLSLGPVNLSLLGLNVSLDNCNGGPVTVDIGTQTGPGQLLGNLLNSLSHLLDGPANTHAVTNALNRVAGAINNLAGQL